MHLINQNNKNYFVSINTLANKFAINLVNLIRIQIRILNRLPFKYELIALQLLENSKN